MKCISFNINSVRARPHQLIHLRDNLDPDVIGLQETKVDDPEFPMEEINEIGYHAEHWGGKGHYGVALLSKEKPIFVQKGFPDDDEDEQKRFIHCTYKIGKKEFDILNGYFPQGENREHPTKFPKKVKYYKDLEKYIQNLDKENIILMFQCIPLHLRFHNPNCILLNKRPHKRLQTYQCFLQRLLIHFLS